MRTVKVIKKEAEEALKTYNDHFNHCPICQTPVHSAEEEITCHNAEWLYEEYEGLMSEADYAEQVFEAELKDRN
ncbi:hypothetical protein ACRTDU_03990 [Sunxiuqinia elliptica]